MAALLVSWKPFTLRNGAECSERVKVKPWKDLDTALQMYEKKSVSAALIWITICDYSSEEWFKFFGFATALKIAYI
jgi:hypothetical protein